MHINATNASKPPSPSPSLLSHSMTKSEFVRSLSTSLNLSATPQSSSFYTSTCWEQLGQTTDLSLPRRQPVHVVNNAFASDSERSLLHLDGAHRKSTNRLTGCRVASMEVLLAHIKSLFVGIESDSFRYDENEGVFKMIEDITVGDIRPSTTENLLREFVECGSCYKRLKMLIGRDRNADLERREHSYMFAVGFILQIHRTDS